MYEVIVGSNGFVGTHLTRYLEEQGKTVVSLDWQLLTDPFAIRRFLQAHQPCRIYYLAAYGNLHGQNDVREIYNAIVLKLFNVLEASQEVDCQGIVTTGSTSEYGQVFEPMFEDDVLKPTSFYGAAKAAATHLAQVWSIRHNFPIVVYRPASITGVGDHYQHLIPTLIRSCMEQEPMSFIDEPTHDYIDVTDIVSAISILGERIDEVKGDIFNVGNSFECSNGSILEMIEEITGK
jgi:nucleoside-diphosphate-sugar epimerase